MEKLKAVDRKKVKLILLSFLAGAIWLLGVRFVLVQDTSVHYHANFAVFVDGERLALDRPTLYEEVQLCGGDYTDNPKARVHMHDMVSHIVHVHDDAATWGHFFANIGMTNGDTVFRIDNQTYLEADGLQIDFMLNGAPVETTANMTIGNEDVLLVSIGSGQSDQQLQAQYDQIMGDAAQYNELPDPATCSGSAGLSFTDRLKAAVGSN